MVQRKKFLLITYFKDTIANLTSIVSNDQNIAKPISICIKKDFLFLRMPEIVIGLNDIIEETIKKKNYILMDK